MKRRRRTSEEGKRRHSLLWKLPVWAEPASEIETLFHRFIRVKLGYFVGRATTNRRRRTHQCPGNDSATGAGPGAEKRECH